MSTSAPGQTPNPVQTRLEVHALLDHLHALSLQQEASLDISSTASDDTSFDDRVRDKLVALDQDKCQFVYQLIRAKGARAVLEIGTSFGVSTIYLALAVLANQALAGGGSSAAGSGSGAGAGEKEKEEKDDFRVIATEHEPTKAAAARQYWEQVGDGVPDVIDLREGDLRETLPGNLPPLDFVLLDIWAPMALPALRLAQPYLRPGAIIICDNSIGSAHRYKDLQAYMRAEGSGYINLTLPYSKGLEMSVWVGASK